MNKKGFTLIEITVAVLILAAITLITVPIIKTTINNSRNKAYNITIDTIEEAAKSYYYMHSSVLQPDLDSEGTANVPMDQLKGSGLVDESIKNPKDDTTMNGYVKITKTGNSITYEYIEGTAPFVVNAPKLATGMTPIKWNGTTWVNTTSTDVEWYDYENKIWANAKTADGSYWVWIPRYIFKITSGWHTTTAGTIEVQFSNGTSDNWNSSVIGNINIDTAANASNNTWTNEPAFTFGTTELTGIWVAKFEPSVSNTSDLCYTSSDDTNCNKTTLIPRVVPNVKSWRYIQIGNMFTVTRSMETNNVYGWGTTGIGIDTHMMKNVEWGAVAYLSKSIYGMNGEIWTNPANDYTTGCAGDSVSASSTTGCLRSYETTNGQEASTTGNIYGIYDMSGGTVEYVSAYVNNGNATIVNNGNSIYRADAKYKDVYTASVADTRADNYALTINHKGDAFYETSGNCDWVNAWYNDYIFTPYVESLFFSRGSSYSCGSCAGIFASGANTWGDQYNPATFRPVLLVDPSL